MHTDLASADKVWVPTEDRGNQKQVASYELRQAELEGRRSQAGAWERDKPGPIHYSLLTANNAKANHPHRYLP